jgi:undecaprenyl-diphosphatase
MSIWQSIAIGVVQGLTEFLPVSSSGHLVITQKLMGIEPDLPFLVLVHIGTLVAVMAYFFKDILDLIKGFFSGIYKMFFEVEHPRAVFYSNTPFKLSCFIIIGSIFTAIVALSFKDLFESFFASTLAVGGFLILTGVLLVLAEWIGSGKRFSAQMNFIDAVIVGLAQGIAVAPGLSRAGATISAALSRNLERKFAARFSFLIAIPAILGAGLVEAKGLLSLGASASGLTNMLLGFIASVVSGYLAIKIFMSIISRMSLRIFAYYCFAAGSIVIAFSLL